LATVFHRRLSSLHIDESFLIFWPAIIEKFNNTSEQFFGGVGGPRFSRYRFALVILVWRTHFKFKMFPDSSGSKEDGITIVSPI